MEYEPNKPIVYPILTDKIRDLEDVKKLLKAIGLAMTEQYAIEWNMEHLIDTTKEPTQEA